MGGCPGSQSCVYRQHGGTKVGPPNGMPYSLKMKLFAAMSCLLLGLEISLACQTKNTVTERESFKRSGKKPSLRAGSCAVDLDVNAPAYPPLLLYPNNTWVLPTLSGTSRQFQLASSQQVSVACPGTGDYLIASSTATAAATCSAGVFALNSVSNGVGYGAMGCYKKVKESLKESTSCGANNEGTLVTIGWDIDTTFVGQIQVCHDKTKSVTLYSIDVLYGAAIDASDGDATRPSFKKGNYFGTIPVDTAYSQTSQLTTLTTILGSSELANTYFNVSKSWYFARGHLAPDADFIFLAHQDATYYYINAAPQWQAFNNGNWKALEMATRDQGSRRKRDLNVYTGAHDILKLKDVNNNLVPIYLYYDTNNVGYLPAPKYYWKVVHDPASNEAVAFVGINNPHINSLTSDYVLCADVCSQITWATWARTNFGSGYTYCCTVADLKKSVPNVPDLGSVKLMV